MSRAISDEAFLDNLEEIFLAEGFRSIKIGDLASRLKCSRRRFYEYAGGKEELFLLVCGRIFKRVQDVGWQRAHDEPDIIKKIGAYLSAGIEGAQRMSAVFQEDIGSFAGGRDLYDDHQRKRIDGLRSLVEDGIAQGVFRNLNSYLVAEITLMTVKRIRQPEFHRNSGMTFSEALAELSEFIRFGLVNDVQTADGEQPHRVSQSDPLALKIF